MLSLRRILVRAGVKQTGLRILGLSLLAGLAGCEVGPDYHRPSVETPNAYKEQDKWKPAQPQDQTLRGNWWEIYGDPTLNGLLSQVAVSNQNVLAAAAQYRQATALLDAAIAAYWPTVNAGVSSTSSHTASTQFAIRGVNTFDNISLNASWELDVWGRIRRLVEANRASAAASAADLAAAILSLQTTLAESYIQLRIVDQQTALLQRTVAADRTTLQITKNMYEGGTVSNLDVELANTQLKSTQAQMLDLGIQRAQLEHAIAILIGKAPADFSLAPTGTLPVLPPIPVTVPSALLQRRPDIAAAERRVAAANAEIGVAEAAFFPTFMLNAGSGYQGISFANLISAPNQYWSVGPALAGTLFNGGLFSAQKAQAVAAYDSTVAAYRQTVLTSFQEVEDNLAALRILKQEIAVQQAAVRSAHVALRIANNQYEAGTVSYLNVMTAEVAALNADSSNLNMDGRDLVASVGLVTALGGNW
ncbi:MAG: efflux transporter outer membrane subunit [Sulfuriferula sp.]